MKLKNNENGYALLMVIILVLLFTTLGMGLLVMNINASKQFNLKEDQVQARHQAEMGVLHYKAILEDKVKSSSTLSLSCNDLEGLLGSQKKLATTNYTVIPVNTSGLFCKVKDNGKLLEIKIKSTGFIDDKTKKNVEATFYATNQGLSSTAPPTGGIIMPPKVPNSSDTEILNNLEIRKETIEKQGNLIINNKLYFGVGYQGLLKIKKDLYVSGTLDIGNQACIATGSNFTVKDSINFGNSKTSLLVGKDAYFPSVITNWKKTQVKVYISGNLFLPKSYSITGNGNIRDLMFYVAGKVYQMNSLNQYVQITNPFKKLEGRYIEEAKALSCSVPAISENTPGTPKWVLQDEKIVDYQ